jgi:sulfur carrier protein
MIILNGKSVEQGESRNVNTLLNAFQIEGAAIVIEKNGVILKKDDWAQTIVQDNDRFEVIRFVGGG